jgi:soluble lytic murein transglycosylase-like protein
LKRHLMPCAAALALLLAASVQDAAADVWKRVDERGTVHLTDRPHGPGWVLIMRTRRSSAAAAARGIAAQRRARFEPLIAETARRFNLDARLVHAVVRAESSYDPDALSHKGAVGLMQLMPGTALRYGVADPRDPAQNLLGGVNYLRDLLQQFRNVDLALAAYNAGENAVIRHGNMVPPFPETHTYVQRVLRYYQNLKGLH